MSMVQVGQHGHTSIYVGNAVIDRFDKDSASKAKANEKGNIFAGNTIAGNAKRFDAIAERKRMMQKNAFKIVSDAFAGQKKVDESLEELEKSKDKMLEKAGNAKSEMDLLSERKQELMEYYQVEPDSEEQKNLDLLKKSMDPRQSLTQEEYQQLEEMGDLTEYQESALEIDTQLEQLEKQRENALHGYQAIEKGIIDSELEELKSHPMVDAQKESSDMLATAAKETAFSLIQEAKDHIDEEMEKKKEEMQKLQEEKKEEKEKLEKAKEKKEKNSEWIEGLKQNSTAGDVVNFAEKPEKQDTIVKKIKQLIRRHNLLDEDILGIKVDAFI